LQSISKEYYEAASIDGASGPQQFFRITLPLLRPAMIPAAMYGLIVTFNLFNLIYMVSGGGPLRQTEILVTTAFRLVNEQRLDGADAHPAGRLAPGVPGSDRQAHVQPGVAHSARLQQLWPCGGRLAWIARSRRARGVCVLSVPLSSATRAHDRNRRGAHGAVGRSPRAAVRLPQ